MTGLDIGVGGVPNNLMHQTSAPELEGTMSARTALTEILRGTRVPVSWEIMNGTDHRPEYWLNVSIRN